MPAHVVPSNLLLAALPARDRRHLLAQCEDVGFASPDTLCQPGALIRYAGGHITVIDRPKLAQLCCECYSVVKRESDGIEHVAASRGA